MEIDVDTYAPPPFGSHEKNLGKVKVILNKKMFLWLNVVQGKHTPFCKFQCIKLDEENYVPTMGWLEDEKMERKIGEEVIKKLKDRGDL